MAVVVVCPRASDPNFPSTHFPSTFYLLYFNCSSSSSSQCQQTRSLSAGGLSMSLEYSEGRRSKDRERKNIFLASGLWLYTHTGYQQKVYNTLPRGIFIILPILSFFLSLSLFPFSLFFFSKIAFLHTFSLSSCS